MAVDDDLVKPADAYRLCGGLSESTIRRLIAANAFPRPITLNRDRHGRPVRVAFLRSELHAWIRARVTADRGDVPPASPGEVTAARRRRVA
jgi:predicted DNA-binding transcriptional regulator AlpA